MHHFATPIALVTILIVAPLALGAPAALPPPLLNGDFDTGLSPILPPAARPLMDACVGVGHQVIVPLYSDWGDWMIAVANDPARAGDRDAFSNTTTFPVEHALAHADDPTIAVACDPQHREFASVNPWHASQDRATGWSNDAGTRFYDIDHDGDHEAVIPTAPAQHAHNLWQSVASPQQAYMADFAALRFTLEAGAIPSGANVQVGLSLTPVYMQHPYVGVFWEGALVFRAADMQPDAQGLVSLDPVAQGEIVCPAGYPPCAEFKAWFDGSDAFGKKRVLAMARIVQTSFWQFNNPLGPVALDDVAYVGAKPVTDARPQLNPGA